MKMWCVDSGVVRRGGVPVATISKAENDSLQWDGHENSKLAGFYRFGFEDEASILADVKYFYQHPPVTRLTFKSGRVVEVR